MLSEERLVPPVFVNILMTCSLVVLLSKQFSKAQTPIVHQVYPPSGVPGKKSSIKIGIIVNLFAKVCCKPR